MAESDTLTLAPMAGAGIGKQLADALLAEPGFLALMRETALGGLKATTKRWVAEKRITVDEPDYKTRAQMFFGLLAHMEGEPVKRVIHQHINANGGVDLMGALQESPELAALLGQQLEKAGWRKSGRNGKAKPVAPVEAH